jgi:hypothetical protein
LGTRRGENRVAPSPIQERTRDGMKRTTEKNLIGLQRRAHPSSPRRSPPARHRARPTSAYDFAN